MSAIATANGVRQSPRKVAVVASLVRGRTVADALVILSHVPRRSSEPVIKAVKSAAANAEHNHNYKPATLTIIEISVTPGTRLQRYRPAAHGRALPFQRKSSNIRVVVDGEKRASKVEKASTVDKPVETKKEAK